MTQLIKKRRKKSNLRRSQFSKKRGGGVRRGLIMITDSMIFFKAFPKCDCVRLYWLQQLQRARREFTQSSSTNLHGRSTVSIV